MTMEYKTNKENFDETLAEARKMTVKDISIALQQRGALHTWAVKAYEQVLAEKYKVLYEKGKVVPWEYRPDVVARRQGGAQ